MKVYLDLCSLQRPLDSKNQVRIIIEAESILAVLSLIEIGEIALVSSEALVYEAGRNPNPSRKEYALDALLQAKTFIKIDSKIEQRSEQFIAKGVSVLDSLHLACAESAKVDCFCTCDDKFYKKAKLIHDLKIQVVSPIELIEEIEK
ncbi:MAG: PIN domain-containing protein [Desulfosalsimonadaceae bacterium]